MASRRPDVEAAIRAGREDREIAESLGVSVALVGHYRRRMGLPPRVRGSLIDPQSRRWALLDTALAAIPYESATSIARRLGISPDTASRRRAALGIPQVPRRVRGMKLAPARERVTRARPSVDSDRLNRIRRARDEGRSLADIGRELGLSRERVRQLARKETVTMARPHNEAARAAVRDPANYETPTSVLAEQTGISDRTLAEARAVALAAGEIPPPPSNRGGNRRELDVRVLTLRLPAAQYRALADYAERTETEIALAITENLIGQCWLCSEPAILDARKRPLCEACIERTGMTEAPDDRRDD